MSSPQPTADTPPIPTPQDRPYPGRLDLRVDATDVQRRILRIEQTIPIPGPGPVTLLYPKWLPGFHSPASAIELLAGLEIHAGETRLDWRRDPVEMHAFHVEAPPGTERLEVRFQFLTPTASSQGDVSITTAIACIRWGALLLYPAGYASKGIEVAAALTVPPGWGQATPLRPVGHSEGETRYAPAPLDELVDSPVLAGRWFRTFDIDPGGKVQVALAADAPENLAVSDDQVADLTKLVGQVDALFQARPFDRYVILAALSDQIGGGGVEHHDCCEIVLKPDHFTAWTANATARDVFAHEYTHAWNGKHRRGADSWTPSFELPIRNSLMWVYEGLTQYWGEVLTVRAGLWTPDQALEALARTAALYANRPGGRWRSMSDTTRDPIIAERAPLPWPSWQRSEDYYSEGQLVWLDVDTLIRELSDDTRSLDDFARAFFGPGHADGPTDTYRFEDVIAGLDAIVAHDWAGMLQARLESRERGAPLDGLARGGRRLVYRDSPGAFTAAEDAAAGMVNLRFSIGLTLTLDGTVQEVIWEGPAFEAGLVAGAQVTGVNGRRFSADVLTQAVRDAKESGAVELIGQHAGEVRPYRLRYDGGLRYPHLEPIPDARPRLEEILRPRS